MDLLPEAFQCCPSARPVESAGPEALVCGSYVSLWSTARRAASGRSTRSEWSGSSSELRSTFNQDRRVLGLRESDRCVQLP